MSRRLMLMSDPLTRGALSSISGANLSSYGVPSTSGRRSRIPAKIPQYSNDCLGLGKIRTCEIFANDAVLSGACHGVDLSGGDDINPSEEV
jgi:hypothetical protein